jgi:hypothetical protein
MTAGKSMVPIFYCADRRVQAFIERGVRDFNPYRPIDEIETAEQLFRAARDRFGDMACWDAIIRKH